MFIICHIYPEIGLSVREFALVCASMPTCPAASQGVVPSWPRRTWTLQTRSSRGQSRKSSCRTLWPGSVMLLQDHKLPRLWWNRAHNWWVLDRLHPFSNRLVYWYHLAKRGKQTQVLHYTTFSWWRRQTQHIAQPHKQLKYYLFQKAGALKATAAFVELSDSFFLPCVGIQRQDSDLTKAVRGQVDRLRPRPLTVQNIAK